MSNQGNFRRSLSFESLEERRVLTGTLGITLGEAASVVSLYDADLVDLAQPIGQSSPVGAVFDVAIRPGTSDRYTLSMSGIYRNDVLFRAWSFPGVVPAPLPLDSRSDLTVTSDGRMAVTAQHRIYTFNSDGSLANQIETSGVVDVASQGGEFYYLTPGGEVRHVANGSTVLAAGPTLDSFADLAMGASGRVAVSRGDNTSTVDVYQLSGPGASFVETFSGGAAVIDLTFDSIGDLYLLTTDEVRVRENGQFRALGPIRPGFAHIGGHITISEAPLPSYAGELAVVRGEGAGPIRFYDASWNGQGVSALPGSTGPASAVYDVAVRPGTSDLYSIGRTAEGQAGLWRNQTMIRTWSGADPLNLLDARSDLAVASDGRLAISTSNNVYLFNADGSSGPSFVTTGVVDIAAQNNIFYVLLTSGELRVLGGPALGFVGPVDVYADLAMAPFGAALAVSRTDSQPAIFVYRNNGSSLSAVEDFSGGGVVVDLTYDTLGRLYILNTNQVRARHLGVETNLTPFLGGFAFPGGHLAIVEPLPDFRVGNVIVPPIVESDLPVQVQATIYNTGANLPQDLLLKVHLEVNGSGVGATWTEVGAIWIPPPVAGLPVEVFFPVAFSQPGLNQLRVVVDNLQVAPETDNQNNSSPIIDVLRTFPPVADAGGPYEVSYGQDLVLDGSQSYDPDGFDQIVSYEWYVEGFGTIPPSATSALSIPTLGISTLGGRIELTVVDELGVRSEVDASSFVVRLPEIAGGPEFQVNSTTYSSQNVNGAAGGRNVAFDGAGNFVVVWQSSNQDGSGIGVYGQRFDVSGAKVGLEFQISTTTFDHQMQPTVAMDQVGNFVVAWVSHGQDGSGHGIFAQRFDAAGEKIGDEFQVSEIATGDQIAPAIAMDPAGDLANPDFGDFVVVWMSNEQGGGRQIFGRRYDDTGHVGNVFQIGGGQDEIEAHNPSVAMNAHGEFVVAWSSLQPQGWDVRAQRYDGDGVIDNSFLVNSVTSSDQLHPDVAISGGAFVITWSGYLQDGSHAGIFAQRYAPHPSEPSHIFFGVPQGHEIAVNTRTAGDQIHSSVALDAAGNFAIAWSSAAQDGSGLGVYGQRFDTQGTPLGTEFRINNFVAGDQQYPSVAMRADGALVAVWQSEGQDGNASGVYARLFSYEAINAIPPILSVQPLHVAEGTAAVLGRHVLDAFDPDTPADELRYQILVAPLFGALLRDGLRLGAGEPGGDTFTQLDLDRNLITYQHDGGEEPRDELTFDLLDLRDGSVTPTSVLPIVIQAINDVPQLSIQPLHVYEGTTVALGRQTLDAFDPDTPPEELLYFVRETPRFGTLLRFDVALGAGDFFLQHEVDNNWVTYQHDGSENFEDTLWFEVHDVGDGLVLPVSVLPIHVLPVNDPPWPLPEPQVLHVEEGTTVIVGADVLAAFDLDTPPHQLIYRIVTPPQFGALLRDGQQLVDFSFSQRDVDEGRITYQHDDSETLADEFQFELRDLPGGPFIAGVRQIQVHPVYDLQLDAIGDLSFAEDRQAHFVASYSGAGAGATAIVLWGDGSDEEPARIYETTLEGEHEYEDPGDYTVIVRLTHSDGVELFERQFTITISNSTPTATILSPAIAREGDVVRLTARASDGFGGDLLLYSWSINGGTASTPSTDPRFEFYAPSEGTYDVALIVVDDEGTSTSESTSIAVQNVAPYLADLWIEIGSTGQATLHGRTVERDSTDVLKLVVDWDDDSPLEEFVVTTGTLPAGITHSYRPGTYQVQVYVEDDEHARSGAVAQVTDVAQGSSGADPEDLIELGGKLYFFADNGTTGLELWRLQPDMHDAVVVTHVTPDNLSGKKKSATKKGDGSGSVESVIVGGKLLFAVADRPGLWQFDPLAQSPTPISLGGGYSSLRLLTSAQGGASLVFTAYNVGTSYEEVLLLAADGSLTPLAEFESITELAVADGKVFVSANLAGEEDIYVIDISAEPLEATPLNLPDADYTTFRNLTVLGSDLYFTARHDGQPLLLVHQPGQSGAGLAATLAIAPSDLVILEGDLYLIGKSSLTDNEELWRYRPETPPTVDSLILVADLGEGPAKPASRRLYVVDDALYFAADDGQYGSELWRYDPATQATQRLTDVVPGPTGSYPGYPTLFNGEVYFVASDDVFGDEIWKLTPTTLAVEFVSPAPVLESITVDPAGGGEGSTFQIVAVASGAGELHYAWEVWRGDSVVESGHGSEFTFVPRDEGEYLVKFVVSDASGEFTSEGQASFAVANVSPFLNSLTSSPADEHGLVRVEEGGIVTLYGSIIDSGVLDSHTVTIDWGDGTISTPDVEQTLFTFEAEHRYLDDGSYRPTITVRDEDGGESQTSIDVQVNNVAPVVAVDGAATVVAGTPYFLNILPSDNGADPLTSWTIAWGDGRVDVVSGHPSSASHVYALVGPLTITATASDGRHTYVANPVNVTVSPLPGGGTVLVGDDTDETFVTGAKADVIFAAGGNNTVNAGNGNNKINAGDGANHILAGTGKDAVTVGSGDNIIDAGDGANTITAGGGNNEITTGTGSDTIYVGGGDNSINAGDGANKITAGHGDNEITTGFGNDTVTLGDGDNLVNAGDGANKLTAGHGDNEIATGLGNDTVILGDGDNLVNAGDGANRITAGNGSNQITAGAGNDVIKVGVGDNTIDAGEGKNTITTGIGSNTITGGDGVNTITTLDGDDVIVLGSGDNVVKAGAGTNAITAGDGNNRVVTTTGDDLISLGGGNNIVNAGAGNNQITAGDGANAITTTDGNDIIHVGSGDNTIKAGNGDNEITATGAGSNNVTTGTGADAISTGAGNDIINSGLGNDTIYAGAGNDVIQGQGGADSIYGEDGDDVITWDGADLVVSGGTGVDALKGSNGADIDLTKPAITGFEAVLTDAGVNKLTISIDKLASEGLTSFLAITGSGDDTVTILESGTVVVAPVSASAAIAAIGADPSGVIAAAANLVPSLWAIQVTTAGGVVTTIYTDAEHVKVGGVTVR